MSKNKVKRYIITTAVPGCDPRMGFLNACLSYAKLKDAEILILPSTPLYANDELDPYILANFNIIHQDKHLNENIIISSLPINPEAEDPVIGLGRHSHLEGSLILASPKQRLESIASPSDKLPRVVMTTGACTKPNYRASKKGIIASKDHVVGGLIVEVEDTKIYHYRQIQASRDGSFVDLGIRYSASGKTKKEKVEALIPGDWHVGSTDPVVSGVVDGLLSAFNPKYLILHDFFDGISINHHIEHKILQKANMRHLNDLSLELGMARGELVRLASKANNVLVVKSNHDEFIDKYIDEAKYLNDERNHIIGLKLALSKAIGNDPFESSMRGTHANLKNVRFLQDDESFRITPKQIEVAVHGHKGPNGSSGSIKSLERAYGAIVHGHTHSPSILRDSYCVGTSTHLRLSYNKGPSSWMQTLCVVYQDGTRQLLNVINGKIKA